jgi:hypothetical protein
MYAFAIGIYRAYPEDVIHVVCQAGKEVVGAA